MKLLLHIGTEKTGSSFLQFLCGRNRDLLQQGRIYFPGAGKDERRLLDGMISPGNARELAQLINTGEWAAVSTWLGKRVRVAENRGCDRLLLSHELLINAMSRNGVVNKFELVAEQTGINDIEVLLIIRNPVDQAVSLFKHRAKSGMADEIDQWIRTSYALPQEISEFLAQVKSSSTRIAIRKYSKDSVTIADIFFKEWLGLSTPQEGGEKLVNPSLTLSELQFVRQLAKTRAASVPLLYSKLLSISPDGKASDDQLDRSAREIVENYLCQFSEIWNELDKLLTNDGGIDIPKLQVESIPSEDLYRFSDLQLHAIADFHDESLTFKYQLGCLVNHYLLRPLRQIKSRLLTFLEERSA